MAGRPEADTDALDNSFFETQVHHHRLYQTYAIENLSHFAPVDEDESDRLNILHNVQNIVFDNRLIFPPITRPRRILDCGYGTGAWAVQLAETYPRCEVLGVDINPSMQPEEMPENVYLQIDDLNRRFTFPSNNFDLVNSRMMAASIHANRWPQYMRDMFRVIRPGGWVQMVELHLQAQSDNGTLTDVHALRQWSSLYSESMEGLGKDLRVASRLSNLMRESGFVDVEARMIPLPTCGWPTEQREHNIGVANRENIQRLLSSLAIYPFTERLGMPIQDVHLLVAQARLEADEVGYKAYFPLHICIGRKSRTRR